MGEQGLSLWLDANLAMETCTALELKYQMVLGHPTLLVVDRGRGLWKQPGGTAYQAKEVNVFGVFRQEGAGQS